MRSTTKADFMNLECGIPKWLTSRIGSHKQALPPGIRLECFDPKNGWDHAISSVGTIRPHPKRKATRLVIKG